MGKRRRRWRVLTIAVLVAGAGTIVWMALGELTYSRYVLYRLETDPSSFQEYLDGPRSQPVETALAAFLETSEGQEAWRALRALRYGGERLPRKEHKEKLEEDVVRFGGPSMLRTLVEERVRIWELKQSQLIGARDPTFYFGTLTRDLASTLVDVHFEEVSRAWTATFEGAAPHVRLMALRALPSQPDRTYDVLPILTHALSDPAPDVRNYTVGALAEIGAPALRFLTSAVEESDVSVRRTAARSIGMILRRREDAAARDVRLALDALTEALGDPDRDLVQEALLSLIRAGAGTEATRSRLQALLEHEDAEIRFSAEHALEVVTVVDNASRS